MIDNNEKMNKRQKLNDDEFKRKCYIPYEKSVLLDFNYWMLNDTLTCNDMNGAHNSVTNLILSILSGKKPNPIKQINTNSNIIIISAVGYDSNSLFVEKSNFLSQCSSMPVKYSNKNPFKMSNNGLKPNDEFNVLEVENMTTLLLQPENNSIPWLQLFDYGLNIKQIFIEGTFIFHDECKEMSYNIVQYYFTANNQSYKMYLGKYKKDNDTVYKEDDIWGDFVCKSDVGKSKGLFNLRQKDNSSILSLFWEGSDSKISELQYDNEKNHFIENNYGNNDDKESMKLVPHSVKRNIDFYSSSIVEDSNKIANNNYIDGSMKEKLKDDYNEIKYDIEKLVISSELLLMMGYSEDDNFISTDSIKWNKDNNNNGNNNDNTHIYFDDEVEEGEEIEEEIKMEYNFLCLCALDCEMCETSQGLELTRITVICPEKGLVYDTLVKPYNPIINYNTEYSGIKEADLVDVKVNLDDVHKVLRKLINKDTIIVGHSLDSDFKALKIIHRRVIDTAALFPHPRGLPFKYALKKLASIYLKKDIQNGNTKSSKEGQDQELGGHDSIEDSLIALELALYKAKYGNFNSRDYLMLADYKFDYNLFEHICRNMYFDSFKKFKANFSVHGCLYLGERNDWERHALGYKEDTDICFWANLFHQQLQHQPKPSYLNDCNIAFNLHNDSITAVNTAIDEIAKTSNDTENCKLMWLDIPNSHHDDSVRFLDTSLVKLFEVSKSGTVFIVVNQSRLLNYKKFLALKQQLQWMIQKNNNKGNNNDKNNMKIDRDEISESLQASAIQALHGLLLIRIKE